MGPEVVETTFFWGWIIFIVAAAAVLLSLGFFLGRKTAKPDFSPLLKRINDTERATGKLSSLVVDLGKCLETLDTRNKNLKEEIKILRKDLPKQLEPDLELDDKIEEDDLQHSGKWNLR